MIESAVSSAVSAPRSRPSGALIRARSASPTPAASNRSRRSAWACCEPIAPMYAGSAPSASRSTASSIFGSFDSTATYVARSMPPSRSTALLRPGDDHLDRVGEPLAGREPGARIDHVRPPAHHARQMGEVVRVGDRPEDEQPWRGRGDVDEQLAAQLRALGPHQLLRVGEHPGVERRVAERPLAPPVGPGQHPAPGARTADRGHQGGALVPASGVGERPLHAHGS